ncbi:ABC transporter substrate-binding protein [Caviibacter abscessus]|uniref:ABC transporter substrate-binding protein n=1 Tax=Caviibacter abscessus TaxID=1766719 RepID=UPI00082E6AD7|nr:extracellular solute-binding protein [Caviibacter abscessus]
MKKILTSLFVLFSMFLIVSCNNTKESKELTFYLSSTEENIIYKKLREVADNFEKENAGVKINILAGGGSSYESTMKTRMAANDLPDIFSTHGWSVLRYGEYLEPLQNREWVKNINTLIKDVITDAKNNNIYALPLNMDITGIVFNAGVLEKLGINVDNIKTWDDFKAVSEKIKASGITPIHMGAKDLGEAGHYYDWAGSSFVVTPKDNQVENLLAGKFETKNWADLSQLLLDFKNLGYINKDVLTSTPDDTAKALAEDKAVFTFGTNGIIKEAKEYNPNAKIAFMPIPARYTDDDPTLISGEEWAFGVWKDSKNKDVAIAFLDYLARPENIKLVNEAIGAVPGLINADVDTGELKPYFEKYTNVKTVPYLDRVYLPSGMWSTLCDVGIGILSGELTPQQSGEKLKADFEKLYNAQK